MEGKRVAAVASLFALFVLICSMQVVGDLYGSFHGAKRSLQQLLAPKAAGDGHTYALASDCAWHAHRPLFIEYSYTEAAEEAAALANKSVGPFTCPACGAKGVTVERWGNIRESGPCPACGASNRNRQLAVGATLYATQRLDVPVETLPQLQAQPLRIYNTQCSGSAHTQLKNSTGYVCSEYLGPQYEPGKVVKRIRHEDLQSTSFPSDSFDLILSTEVFEHIPDPYRAHAELLRVLRPGGAHVFTVPYIPAQYADVVKAQLAPNGSIVFHGAPEYHGDPIRKEGIPVFTIFAQEMTDRLCRLGYLVRVLHLRQPALGILGGNSWVFMAVKPPAAGGASHALT